ncbi:hypothetical protein MTKAM_06830 [Moorella thermoacetica]
MIIVLAGEQGERVATGVKLYREGLAPRLLMTGGPVKWNVAAADIMADQAKFLGVPEKDIVLEKWAISTYENSLYSLMALGPGDRSGEPGYPYVISMPPGYRRQGILGRAVRDYIHVDDLAAAHVLALEALEQGSPTAAYNLGSGRGYSVLEVIRTAEKVTGKKVPCRVGPRRPGGAGSFGRKSHGGVRLAAAVYRTGGHHCYGLAVALPQAAGIFSRVLAGGPVTVTHPRRGSWLSRPAPWSGAGRSLSWIWASQ